MILILYRFLICISLILPRELISQNTSIEALFPLYETVFYEYDSTEFFLLNNSEVIEKPTSQIVLVSNGSLKNINSLQLDNFKIIQLNTNPRNEDDLDTINFKTRLNNLNHLEILTPNIFFDLKELKKIPNIVSFYSDFPYKKIDSRDFKHVKGVKNIALNGNIFDGAYLKKLKKLEYVSIYTDDLVNMKWKGLRISKHFGVFMSHNSVVKGGLKGLNEVNYIGKFYLGLDSLNSLLNTPIFSCDSNRINEIHLSLENLDRFSKIEKQILVAFFKNTTRNQVRDRLYIKHINKQVEESFVRFAEENELEVYRHPDGITLSMKQNLDSMEQYKKMPK